MKPQRFSIIAGAALAVALLASPGFAQDQDLRNEIEELKKGQQEIQKQLDEVIKLVKARPAAGGGRPSIDVEDKVFQLGDNPAKGASTAKLTLVEFTDYQ